MTQHLTSQELAGFHRKTLPAAQLLRVSEHLCSCTECSRMHRSVADAPTLPQVAKECVPPFHLSYEQMRSSLDAQPNSQARALVEQHILFCELCAAEVEELRMFDTRLQTVAPEPSRTFFDILRDFFKAPQSPAFAGTACSLLAVGLFLLVTAPDVRGVGVSAAGVHADSYFIAHKLAIQAIVGGLSLLAGTGGLLYRFTKKAPKN